ncbi:MAG: shikimate kinase [Lachnospiraceae bacterium]|nr:shikimate kinase [Lachnospiraceae bacterium]
MEKKGEHIILIGFMGAGKTTLGKKLARRLELEFVDTDEMVESQTGQTISDIFARKGEAYFRSLETDMLRQLGQREKRCVVAVGGGLPMQAENRPLLKELGTVIFLETGVETLVQRLKNDTKRPKLQGGDLRERIVTLMNEREAVYRRVADVCVSTDNRSYGSILEEMISKTEK